MVREKRWGDQGYFRLATVGDRGGGLNFFYKEV